MPIEKLAASALVWASAFLEEPEVIEKRNLQNLETNYFHQFVKNIVKIPLFAA